MNAREIEAEVGMLFDQVRKGTAPGVTGAEVDATHVAALVSAQKLIAQLLVDIHDIADAAKPRRHPGPT